MHAPVVVTWMFRYHVCMPINWIWASLCVWWVHLLFVFLSFLHEGQILGQAIQKRTLILMRCHDSCSSSSWGRWGVCPHARRRQQRRWSPLHTAAPFPLFFFSSSSFSSRFFFSCVVQTRGTLDHRSSRLATESSTTGEALHRRSPETATLSPGPRHQFPPVSEVVISRSLCFDVLYIRLDYLVVPVKVLQFLKDTKTYLEDKYAFGRWLNLSAAQFTHSMMR